MGGRSNNGEDVVCVVGSSLLKALAGQGIRAGGANLAASCWLGLFLPREGIVDLGETKDLAVAIAMPLSSHPSFYVLLSMDSIAMARSMVKAIAFSLD